MTLRVRFPGIGLEARRVVDDHFAFSDGGCDRIICLDVRVWLNVGGCNDGYVGTGDGFVVSVGFFWVETWFVNALSGAERPTLPQGRVNL